MNAVVAAPQNRWLVLGFIWIIFVIHGIDRSVLLVLLESIRRDFDLNDSQIGLLSGLAYAVPFALAGVPLGALVDRVRRRTLLLAVLLALWSGLTALGGLAPSFLVLLLTRACVGASEAGAPPTMLSLLGDTFDPKTRPAALSIYYTAPFIGLMSGAVIAGAVSGLYGWRAALFAVGVPGLLLALAVALVLQEPARGRYDPAAAQRDVAPPSIANALRFVAADRPLLRLIAALMLAAFVMLAISSWVPVLLLREFGFSEQQTGGLTALILGLAGALGSLSGGALATRYGRGDPQRLLRLSGFIVLLAAPLALAAPLLTWTPAALALFALWGFVNAAYTGPAWSVCLAAIPFEMRGTVMGGILLLSNLVGAGLGPQAIGLLSDLLRHWHDADSLRHALACIGLVNFIAAALFLGARVRTSEIPAVTPEHA